MTNSEVFARAKTLACDYSNKHIAIGLSKYADVLLPRAPLFRRTISTSFGFARRFRIGRPCSQQIKRAVFTLR